MTPTIAQVDMGDAAIAFISAVIGALVGVLADRRYAIRQAHAEEWRKFLRETLHRAFIAGEVLVRQAKRGQTISEKDALKLEQIGAEVDIEAHLLTTGTGRHRRDRARLYQPAWNIHHLSGRLVNATSVKEQEEVIRAFMRELASYNKAVWGHVGSLRL